MRDGEAFITFYPGPSARVTGKPRSAAHACLVRFPPDAACFCRNTERRPACRIVPLPGPACSITPHLLPACRPAVGVDCAVEAPVIGRQWFSWSPDDAGYHAGEHFKLTLAPARTFYASTAVRRLGQPRPPASWPPALRPPAGAASTHARRVEPAAAAVGQGAGCCRSAPDGLSARHVLSMHRRWRQSSRRACCRVDPSM